jgi:6-phosphogluconate dehydrogenase
VQARELKERAKREGDLPLEVHSNMDAFVRALISPRRVILLVPAGKPVDSALAALSELLDPGDVVVDMGNEWYTLTEGRLAKMAEHGIHYMAYVRRA